MATCEKQGDMLDAMQKMFSEKLVMRNPEKADRERLIGWMIENERGLRGAAIDKEFVDVE